jgi:RNA polymerase sigma-70 factor (ECF subfamily)
MDTDRELLNRALSGDPSAVRELVAKLLPIIQVRVARILARRRSRSLRDVRQEVEDFAQEVFVALFEADGRVLRAWDPARGMSLPSFCGLIAERETASILRSGRRSPWTEDATANEDLERAAGATLETELGIASRDQLRRLTERLREELSPRGLELFQRLIVEEEPLESVAEATKMTPAALYAWRSRFGKLARALAKELFASEPALRVTRQETDGGRVDPVDDDDAPNANALTAAKPRKA